MEIGQVVWVTVKRRREITSLFKTAEVHERQVVSFNGRTACLVGPGDRITFRPIEEVHTEETRARDEAEAHNRTRPTPFTTRQSWKE